MAMTDSWFMMSSPFPLLSVVVAYLILIRIGPRIMKNRPPVMINKLLAYYNAFQVLLAALICVKVLTLRDVVKDGILYAGCHYPAHSQNLQLLDIGWWYFFAKFTELLDTVFFVLRKKNEQITFLHVYHHVVMAIYSWSYTKYVPGGEGAILGLMNSSVHMVMYTYYLLSGLGPRFQKYLWWKKYVTKMQLFQFLLMLAYCAWTHFSPRCQYAAGFTYFISINIIIFLFLFLKFYYKSYKKQRAEKQSKKEEAIQNGRKNNGECKNEDTTENGTKNNEVNSGCVNRIKEDKCDKNYNWPCAGNYEDIPSQEEISEEVTKKETKIYEVNGVCLNEVNDGICEEKGHCEDIPNIEEKESKKKEAIQNGTRKNEVNGLWNRLKEDTYKKKRTSFA